MNSLSYMSIQQVQRLFEQMSPVQRLRWQVHNLCDVSLRDATVLTEEDCEWILKYYRGDT